MACILPETTRSVLSVCLDYLSLSEVIVGEFDGGRIEFDLVVDSFVVRAGLSSMQWSDLLECTDVDIGCELLYKEIFDLFDVIVTSCSYKN